mmetsp:Transcript_29730/g.70667  ORF Transcript_29730/g.70667 Transcript_29730/m.70667 type:complete len:321 (+) Transcript_29730:128-1090(+)
MDVLVLVVLAQGVRILRPAHEDCLAAAAEDLEGGAASDEAADQAHQRPHGGDVRVVVVVAAPVGHRGAHARAHQAAQEPAEAHHGADQQIRDDALDVVANDEAVGGFHGLAEGGAAQGALHVDPVVEVLQKISYASDQHVEDAQEHTAHHVAVAARLPLRGLHQCLDRSDGGNGEGAEADAAKGSGQSHAQALPKIVPWLCEVPARENPTIGGMAHHGNDSTAPAQCEDEYEIQWGHQVLVLVGVVLLVLQHGHGVAHTHHHDPDAGGTRPQHRDHDHAGVLAGDICHHLEDLDGEGNVAGPAAEDAEAVAHTHGHQGQS